MIPDLLCSWLLSYIKSWKIGLDAQQIEKASILFFNGEEYKFYFYFTMSAQNLL